MFLFKLSMVILLTHEHAVFLRGSPCLLSRTRERAVENRRDTTSRNDVPLLPYFVQLTKVFSQGKYYVGGPRKVQIWRNCLLTNTLIKCFCLFIVVINCCLSRTINSTCAPIFLFTVTVSTRECLACFFTLQIQYPSMYWNDPIGRDSNLEYPIGRI
jgi:hypothetical protein